MHKYLFLELPRALSSSIELQQHASTLRTSQKNSSFRNPDRDLAPTHYQTSSSLVIFIVFTYYITASMLRAAGGMRFIVGVVGWAWVELTNRTPGIH